MLFHMKNMWKKVLHRKLKSYKEGVIMSKMKQINLRELKRMLNDAGYQFVRQTGHEVWSNGKDFVSIPVHNLNYKLATKIIIQCNLIQR